MNTALRVLGIAGLTMFGAVAGANGAVMTFTNQADWEAALSGANVLTENFNGAESNFAANSNGNSAGLVTVDVIGHVGDGDATPLGQTGTGFFSGEVDAFDDDIVSLRFNRSNLLGFALLGLQNDVEINPAGLDLEEIGIEVAGEMFLISDILGLTDPADPGLVPDINSTGAIPFIGFVVDGPINTFLLNHGDLLRDVNGSSEEFLLDGLLLAEAVQDGNDVPAPPALLLLGMGLAGLSLTRRRRR